MNSLDFYYYFYFTKEISKGFPQAYFLIVQKYKLLT
ncbi:hypothetical protein FD728_00720 [Pantoea sp. Aalb]|nr:hypothetical protein [Pantoea sp. Aalb]